MIDKQQISFTLSTGCCEKSTFSSFCKITNTARKAGKQIAQMDWLLITRSIKSLICCLLGNFKVGLLLNIWFPQIRENPLKQLVMWAILWETQGDHFDVIFSGMISQFFQRVASPSLWLPFFWFIYTPVWSPAWQLFIPTDLFHALLYPALYPRELTVIDFLWAPLPCGFGWVQPMRGIGNRSGEQGENEVAYLFLKFLPSRPLWLSCIPLQRSLAALHSPLLLSVTDLCMFLYLLNHLVFLDPAVSIVPWGIFTILFHIP